MDPNRIARTLFAFALPFSMLAGCGGAKAPQSPPSQIVSATTSMAEYMGQHYASFDEFDHGIRDGSDVPQSLHLYVANDTDGYVHDKDAIADAWKALCEVRVDFGHPSNLGIDDGDIFITFDSGREGIPFSFCTSEYATGLDGGLYPVENPDKVSDVVGRLTRLIKDAATQVGDRLPVENGAYLWDANDDGELEHIWFDVIDNGDEAPNVLNVRVFGSKMDATTTVDGVYSVDGAWLGADEEGSYVRVAYTAGDYYSHNLQEHGTLRVVDDGLVFSPER
jgi:hypothetical protein